MSPLTLNAALKGGALGLAAGLAILTALLFLGDPDSLPVIVLLLPVPTFAAGFLTGLLRNKQ